MKKSIAFLYVVSFLTLQGAGKVINIELGDIVCPYSIVRKSKTDKDGRKHNYYVSVKSHKNEKKCYAFFHKSP